jgi:hypothetical protein
MKANLAKIIDPTEKGSWQSNVDMWEVLIEHTEQMSKKHGSHGQGMGGMGHGMMRDHGMGGPASPPPAEKKPE